MAKILIIDDDELFCKTLSGIVRHAEQDAHYRLTLEEGLEETLGGSYDLVFLDVRMPDGDGLALLPKIKEASSAPEVIIITGYGDPDGAELAITSGAWDYIAKPSTIETMKLSLLRALQYREEKRASRPSTTLKRAGIIGSSPKIMKCLDLVAQAAATEANVLISGETGTGKELFASAIHVNSWRAQGKFLVLDCAALPKTLVEDILFGHEKGSFTGADKAREGMIRQAHGGSLFLDEIGELPFSVQKAFLRVLQERRFRPLGGKKEIHSDFRLVAATNRDLDAMAQKGQFRKDLLFRLQAFTIALPPLKERREDLGLLTDYFLSELCSRYVIEPKKISPEFFDALNAYDWPGNIRELMNVLETALAAARNEPTLFANHLPTHIRIQAARSSIGPLKQEATEKPYSTHSASADDCDTILRFREYRARVLEEAEYRYLKDLMSAAKGNVKAACRLSGLAKTRVYELLRKHGLWGSSSLDSPD